MKTKYWVLGIICLLVLGIPNMGEGLAQDRHYVLYSDNAFMVFIIDNEQVRVIDGGIYYKDAWQLLDMETIHVEIINSNDNTIPTRNNYDAAWITANLESGEKFWMTYTILNGAVKVSGVFVYDEETLQENYTVMNLSRLFY